jgi:hypothetical protein
MKDRHSHRSAKKLEETGTFLERYILVRIVYIKNNFKVRIAVMAEGFSGFPRFFYANVRILP